MQRLIAGLATVVLQEYKQSPQGLARPGSHKREEQRGTHARRQAHLERLRVVAQLHVGVDVLHGDVYERGQPAACRPHAPAGNHLPVQVLWGDTHIHVLSKRSLSLQAESGSVRAPVVCVCAAAILAA